MKTLFSCFVILINITGCAQYNTDTTYKKYTSGLIYRMGSSFMKGPQKISFQELGKEFSMSDIGLEQYKIAKKKLATAKIFLFTTLACSIAGGATINSNRNLGIGLLAAQFVALSISGQSRNAGNKFLDQAIQVRNKDYLFPGSH